MRNPSDEKLESTIRELKAQLEIMKALKALPTPNDRDRVVAACLNIMEADRNVAGIFDAVIKGLFSADDLV